MAGEKILFNELMLYPGCLIPDAAPVFESQAAPVIFKTHFYSLSLSWSVYRILPVKGYR